MEGNFSSPVERLREDKNATEQDWLIVQQDLRTALLEFIEVTPEEMMLLHEYFWSASTLLMERAAETQPGIAEKIFQRFEEIGAERRTAEVRAV